jgi:hypothetical protein
LAVGSMGVAFAKGAIDSRAENAIRKDVLPRKLTFGLDAERGCGLDKMRSAASTRDMLEAHLLAVTFARSFRMPTYDSRVACWPTAERRVKMLPLPESRPTASSCTRVSEMT